jgi:hypothetical protein
MRSKTRARASACDPLNRINYTTRFRTAIATGQPERAMAVADAARKSADRSGF